MITTKCNFVSEWGPEVEMSKVQEYIFKVLILLNVKTRSVRRERLLPPPFFPQPLPQLSSLDCRVGSSDSVPAGTRVYFNSVNTIEC